MWQYARVKVTEKNGGLEDLWRMNNCWEVQNLGEVAKVKKEPPAIVGDLFL